MTEDITTTTIRRQDLLFLRNIKKKERLGTIWAVLERITKMIKKHKLEEEI